MDRSKRLGKTALCDHTESETGYVLRDDYVHHQFFPGIHPNLCNDKRRTGKSSQCVLVLKIYEDAFVNYKFGYASAEAMILFLLILIVTLIQFYHNKKMEA